MARNLPWVRKDKVTGSNSTTDAGPARKRSRVADLENGEEEDGGGGRSTTTTTTTTTTTQRKTKRAPLGSPSSSPPAPPSPEEYMREGFDQDDIYMMVEDQFQTIAQSFTRHLHQAEYRRLTEEANKKKASTISNISRPTDSSTSMSTVSLKRKEARELAERQSKGLRNVTSYNRKPAQKPTDDRSDWNDDDDDDKPDDPWAGTSLHGLMASPRKSQKALVGLHGVKSSTRAAAGFARSEISPRKERRGIMDVDFSGVSPSRVSSQRRPTTKEDEETDPGDEDDLDAVPAGSAMSPSVRSPLRQKTSPLHSSPKKFAKSEDKREITERPVPAGDENEIRDTSKLRLRRRFWLDDDFDDLPSEPAAVVDLIKGPKEDHEGKKLERRKNPSAAAVPTFLV